MDVDRVADWKRFSQAMEEYIRDHTLICVWHILKYSLRIWNNKGKDKDIEKIAHYACLAWCFSSVKIIKNEARETQ